MNYIIKHANGDLTRVEFPLTIEDLFALIKENEDQFIVFNEPDDIVFFDAGYLKSCIMKAKKSELSKMDMATSLCHYDGNV